MCFCTNVHVRFFNENKVVVVLDSSVVEVMVVVVGIIEKYLAKSLAALA